jgi:hypothetical protein
VDTVVFAGCNLPNCLRASLIEASERGYRTVLVTDAVSQGSEQGFAEVSRIGVGLMTVAAVAHALDAHPSDAHPSDGHPSDGHPSDGHASDAHPSDARASVRAGGSAGDRSPRGIVGGVG